jgi:hypothetical protein
VLAAFALALALLLASCTGADVGGSSLSQRVRAWVSASNFSGSTATLRDDVRRMDRARSTNDLLGMKTECAVMVADVRSAYGELTTPDPELTTDLNNAYQALDRAASSCYSGASSGNRQALDYAESQAATGLRWLSAAEDRIRSMGAG